MQGFLASAPALRATAHATAACSHQLEIRAALVDIQGHPVQHRQLRRPVVRRWRLHSDGRVLPERLLRADRRRGPRRPAADHQQEHALHHRQRDEPAHHAHSVQPPAGGPHRRRLASRGPG